MEGKTYLTKERYNRAERNLTLRVVTITPTYNERENIRVLIPKIIEAFREASIDRG